jgi:NAD-reducing hydrogenase large subunit
MSSRAITINPITRVEGHGKVVINLDEQGRVEEARFHILQFRGFEVFCRGRPYEEMPIITQRICGICPVSHQLASAKACDAVLGLEIPETARLLRELLHMGQYIQSHALHFFHLASPDLILGWDSDPAQRNVVGLLAANPDLVVKAIRLRKFGQEIIKALGGKKIHPAFSVPGGVTNPLPEADRKRLLSGFAEAYETAEIGLKLLIDSGKCVDDEARKFANFESKYMGLVDGDGKAAYYDGKLRICGPDLKVLAEFEPSNYLDYLAEHVESWSYMKFPFYKPEGHPDGFYRVGPLARLHVSGGFTTPRASEHLVKFRQEAGNGLLGASLMYHWARLLELIHGLERAEELLNDEGICGKMVKVSGKPLHRQGVGVIEAPRGTLIHHYFVDSQGAMESANLIVATGHNNTAMNMAVTAVAKEYIHGGQVEEGMLNRVEGAIRCYDPCLSCATHALGQMPLRVEIVSAEGKLVHELVRD